MEEKDLQNGESGQEKDNGNPYIEALKEMKEKTVSRESYEKLKGENEQLVRAIINGDSIEVEEEKKEVDIDKLRKELFTEDNNMSNLEFAKNALELRKALLDKGEEDCFVPQGKKIIADDNDYAAAQRVADVLQQCIDYADGDEEAFTNELMRRTVDTGPIGRRK